MHKLISYHSVALNVRQSHSLHHWSFERSSSGTLEGIVRFAARAPAALHQRCYDAELVKCAG